MPPTTSFDVLASEARQGALGSAAMTAVQVPGAGSAEAKPYQLAFTEVSELPIVAVSTKAPSVEEARALAAAAPEALRNLIQTVQQRQDIVRGAGLAESREGQSDAGRVRLR